MSNQIRTLKSEWNTWAFFFLVFCFVGWICEVCVFYFSLNRGFVNRGFLFGPFLPVYGFGGALIVLTMRKLVKLDVRVKGINVTPILVFFAIIALATTVELITSYMMEAAIGEFLWDYSNNGPNFQGRISLKSSIEFGIVGTAGLYGLVPFLKKLTDLARKNTPNIYKFSTYLVIGCFMADVAARFFLGSNYIGP